PFIAATSVGMSLPDCIQPLATSALLSELHAGRGSRYTGSWPFDPLVIAAAFLQVSSNMMKLGMRVYCGTVRSKSDSLIHQLCEYVEISVSSAYRLPFLST